MESSSASTTKYAHLDITTPRDPNTLHNFGPVSKRDFIVYTCERPGGEPEASSGSISKKVVLDWIDFMKQKGIKHVLILLDDNELEIYESPGLLKLYEGSGFLKYHRTPMGENGVNENVMKVLYEAEKNNEKVVAHCTHGMGRSGRVAAAWLAVRYGLPCDQATEEALNVAKEHGMMRMGKVEMLEKWLGDMKPSDIENSSNDT